jgi:hypothetical protein
MTDRELLELAAKAAGIEFGVIHDTPRMKCDAGWTPWNPLTDDGDALRLAVKLGLCLLWQHDWLMAYSGDVSERERHLDDPYAATRRAIVRAAAEIGRSME